MTLRRPSHSLILSRQQVSHLNESIGFQDEGVSVCANVWQIGYKLHFQQIEEIGVPEQAEIPEPIPGIRESWKAVDPWSKVCELSAYRIGLLDEPKPVATGNGVRVGPPILPYLELDIYHVITRRASGLKHEADALERE